MGFKLKSTHKQNCGQMFNRNTVTILALKNEEQTEEYPKDPNSSQIKILDQSRIYLQNNKRLKYLVNIFGQF